MLHDETLTDQIIGAAIDVHRSLGPGLLESAYEQCLAIAAESRNLRFERQVNLPVEFMGRQVSPAYRIDFLFEDRVVVEVKAVDAIHPVHEAQLLTYLKLARKRTGLLINFSVPVLKEGIRRRVL